MLASKDLTCYLIPIVLASRVLTCYCAYRFFNFKVLSALQVQQLASAVVRDGGVTPPLQKLASIGSDGRWRNSYRDMMRFVHKRLSLFNHVKPFIFSVPCPSVIKAGLSKVSVSAALPHEVFASIFAISTRLFHMIFNTKDIPEFWQRESSHRAIPKGVLSRVVPVRFWGDDDSHCKTSSFEALTWMSATVHRQNPFITKLPFGCLDQKSCDVATHEYFYDVFAWSLEVMATGYYPQCDYKGRTWLELKDSHRASLAGSPLANGWSARAWETTGDQKWHHEAFQIPWYYNTTDICHFCPAQNNDSEYTYRDFSDDAPINCPCLQRTHADYVAHFAPSPVPRLARLYGFSLQEWLLLDWMHLVPLGCALKVGGSALLTLAEEGRWGTPAGKWTVRMNIRLKRAYTDFMDWTSKHNVHHSQKLFTCATLSCSEGVSSFPEMKAKAHNSIAIIRWLASFTRKDSGSQCSKHRAALLWSLGSMHVLFSTAGFYLTETEVSDVQRACQIMAKSWTALRSEALRVGSSRWRMHPKSHMVKHFANYIAVTRRNPSTWWTFGDESLIGKFKLAGMKGHKGNCSKPILYCSLVRLGLALEGKLR